MSTRTQTCQNCKFHVPGQRKTMDLSKPTPGLCHRFPPVPSVILAPDNQGGVTLITVTARPEVNDETRSCGEYAARLSALT